MKSLKDFQAIRDVARLDMEVRNDKKEGYKIIVGMGTCGIAAGAREVLSALMKSMKERGLSEVTLEQTGCLDICKMEPVVEVIAPGGEKTTYVHMNADKVAKVVESHVIGGKVLNEYLS